MQFPSYSPASATHSAFNDRVVFTIAYATVGTNSAALRLHEHFTRLFPEGGDGKTYTRALFLAQTLDIKITDEAITNVPALRVLNNFWQWRASANQDELIANAENIWNWFENALPNAVFTAWDGAFVCVKADTLSAPRELLPDTALTDEEITDPN